MLPVSLAPNFILNSVFFKNQQNTKKINIFKLFLKNYT